MDKWWVYIIMCSNKSLYTGITTDVKRRFYEHQNDDKKASKYCARLRPLKLVYKSSPYNNKSDASKEEYRIKKLSNREKKMLIKDISPVPLLILFVIFYFICFGNTHAEPVGLSCYYDTGVKEINGSPTDDEYENKTFGMMLDTELEWFWRFSPEALIDETVEEWKNEHNFLYRESDKKLYVSTNHALINDELNRESKKQEIPNKYFVTQSYELGPGLSITYVNYQVLIYSYYEKKIKITRTGKCMR